MTELVASMPALPLTPGMRVQFEAISPTTGLAVAGVTVALAAIYAENIGEGESDSAVIDSGPFMLVPGPGATAPTEPLPIRGGL